MLEDESDQTLTLPIWAAIQVARWKTRRDPEVETVAAEETKRAGQGSSGRVPGPETGRVFSKRTGNGSEGKESE